MKNSIDGESLGTKYGQNLVAFPVSPSCGQSDTDDSLTSHCFLSALLIWLVREIF